MPIYIYIYIYIILLHIKFVSNFIFIKSLQIFILLKSVLNYSLYLYL